MITKTGLIHMKNHNKNNKDQKWKMKIYLKILNKLKTSLISSKLLKTQIIKKKF